MQKYSIYLLLHKFKYTDCNIVCISLYYYCNKDTQSIQYFIINSIYMVIHVLSLFIYVTSNSQGHIVVGSLRVEEPVHTSWSRFCIVNQRASASNKYQLCNMKRPARDLNWRPQRLKVSTLTTTPPSPPHVYSDFTRTE